MDNFSVIVVTYNRLKLLEECLACIDQQEIKFNNVIVVNNASNDGTKEYLNTLSNKYIVINKLENGGGAKGFQDGVEYVFENLDTNWILLIDDDAMLCPSYLKTIKEYINKFPSCYAFSGSVMTDGKIDITHRKRLKRGLNFSIVPVELEEYREETFEYDLSSFCGLIFSTHLIKEIGVPRGDYFIWYDDSEYSLRLREETKIVNINAIWINHKTKINSNTAKLNWRGYYGTRNRGDVIKRYGSTIEYIFFKSRVKIAMYKNLIYNVIFRDGTYKYNYELYKDGLEDLKNEKFGFNNKYHA